MLASFVLAFSSSPASLKYNHSATCNGCFVAGSRFHRNKGKHSKESSTKSKAKRGSDTAEEGTRTRRRSCTTKTSVFPSSSPTPLIECPEKNCNKRYKQISGLRYHQDHAHRDNAGDNDDKVWLKPVNSISDNWNDNLQSLNQEKNEASVPVFYSDWTSVPVS